MPAGIYQHGPREIDLAPIREAFHASGLTARHVAEQLNWTTVKYRSRRYPGGRRYPDSYRVRRTLGLSLDHDMDGNRRHRARCSYETAVRLITAMGLNPVDFGL